MMLVWTKVHIPLPEEVRSLSLQTKLKRIDWLGSLALVLAVGCLLLGLSLKSTEEFPWSHPLIWGLISAGCVWGVIFVIVEVKIVAYPVMPIRLMKQRTPLAIASSTFFASISVFSLIYNIPLYFSAVRLNSSTDAGLRLLPYSVRHLDTSSTRGSYVIEISFPFPVEVCSLGGLSAGRANYMP